VVNVQTRMRLALDLILSKSNSKKDKICKLDVEHHYTLLHKKTCYKRGKGRKDPKMDKKPATPYCKSIIDAVVTDRPTSCSK
ncbi:hypothetical protein HN873_029368, partial [Arachis hypogaea]